MNIWIPIAALVALVLVTIALFNFVIAKRNQVEFAFASIDAQLKRRYDLVPNLIGACEKYTGYERGLLADLTDTRTRILTGNPGEKAALDTKLASQLRSVFAVAEGYPALRAVEAFTELQRSLNEVEEQLAASRRAFNAAVTGYNNAVRQFPTSIASRLMGYEPRTWFETPPEERHPVKVWR